MFDSASSKLAIEKRWQRYHERQQAQAKSALDISINDLDLTSAAGVKELHRRLLDYLLHADLIDTTTLKRIRTILSQLRIYNQTLQIEKLEKATARLEETKKRLAEFQQ